MQSFGVFDNEISTVFVVDCFAETGLNLFCYIKVIEDRNCSCLKFHDVGLLWGNEFNIVLHFVEHIFIVDVDVFVGGVEQISQ